MRSRTTQIRLLSQGHANPPRCMTARGEDRRSAEGGVRLKEEHLPALHRGDIQAFVHPLPHADGTGRAKGAGLTRRPPVPTAVCEAKTPEAGSRYSCRRAPGRGKPHSPCSFRWLPQAPQPIQVAVDAF